MMTGPNENLEICELTPENLGNLKTLADDMALSKEIDYFDKNLELQAQGRRVVFIGFLDQRPVSYVILNWSPKYGLFDKMDIPEIQDLNVASSYRRRGIATRLIRYCEEKVAEKDYERIGISFGLDPSYGPAQRLYVRLGYVPDGQGVTYDRVSIAHGDMKPVDDQMCLMLIKNL